MAPWMATRWVFGGILWAWDGGVVGYVVVRELELEINFGARSDGCLGFEASCHVDHPLKTASSVELGAGLIKLAYALGE